MAKEDKTVQGEELEMDSTDPRIYEVSYHVLSTMPEEHLAEEASKIKEIIVSNGGIILSEEEPKLMTLAYAIDKVIANKRAWYESAFFGWVKFEAEPAAVAKLKKFLDENNNLLRSLIIKTVRENTMIKKSLLIAKKPLIGDEEKEKEAEKVEIPQEINEAEIDKQIEDLVV